VVPSTRNWPQNTFPKRGIKETNIYHYCYYFTVIFVRNDTDYSRTNIFVINEYRSRCSIRFISGFCILRCCNYYCFRSTKCSSMVLALVTLLVLFRSFFPRKGSLRYTVSWDFHKTRRFRLA